MRPYKWVIIEAVANTVVGTMLSNIVLMAFGIPIGTSAVITVIIIVLSFARSYVLRLFFRRIYG